jgi:hypothetical protein
LRGLVDRKPNTDSPIGICSWLRVENAIWLVRGRRSLGVGERIRVAQQFIGLLAPAGTPKAIINQITQATHVALTDREYQQTLIESGLEPDLASSPEKFRRSLEGDIARWTPIVNAIGLKLD